MASRSRAFRREKARQAVERARAVLKVRLGSDESIDDVEFDALARKLANHLANCSCPLCGNPRKWSGQKSVQEIRKALDEHDDC